MVGRDGVLQFARQKTGEPAFVTLTCPLPSYASSLQTDCASMHRAPEARTDLHMTFLATAQGRSHSFKAMGRATSSAADEAKIQKSTHGLRKT